MVSLAVTLEKENLPPLDEARMEERREKLWDAGNYFLKVRAEGDQTLGSKLTMPWPLAQGINHSYSLTHNLAIVLARIEGLVKEMWSTPGQVSTHTRRSISTHPHPPPPPSLSPCSPGEA